MKKWTEKDKIFLIKNIKEMGYKEIAKQLGSTVPAVKTKAFEMGLKRGKKVDVIKLPVEVRMCAPVRIQTCAPTKVIMVNGKRTEVWGKQSFIQKLEARR